MQKNIILIGFMGCGKTSIGERLSKKMGFQFIDTDQLIEQNAGIPISEIFEKQGEEYFRSLETNTIQRLAQSSGRMVISTGGGLPLRECNAEILKELGLVVYLETGKDTTLKRLAGDTKRPLLLGDKKEERVEKLLMERKPKYEAASHTKIVTDHKSFTDIIDEIMKYYTLIDKRRGERL